MEAATKTAMGLATLTGADDVITMEMMTTTKMGTRSWVWVWWQINVDIY